MHPELLDLPAKHGARLLALGFLHEAVRAHQRLCHDSDPEALHEFRVALRRLRSCLQAYRAFLTESVSAKICRRLRRLARATGESRDLEVHLCWLDTQRSELTARQRTGLVWLREYLAARKASTDDELQRQIARDFPRVEKRLRVRLDAFTVQVRLHHPSAEPSFSAVAGELVQEHATALDRRLTRLREASDQGEAHAARIAAKQLRYLLEPLRKHVDEAPPLVDRLKVLQDTLGDLHDAHLFAEEIVSAATAAAAEQAQRESLAVLEGDAEGETARRERRRDPRPGLLALGKRLRERADRAFASVKEEWLDGRAGEFIVQVLALGERLETRGAKGTEIERKYLLSALPEATANAPVQEIEQGWLPGLRIAERLRRVRSTDGEALLRTVKLGAGVTRVELEEEMTRELFDVLWPLTEGRRVRKRRFCVTDGDHTWEIDQFVDRDLCLAEVELPSEDVQPELPAWLEPHVVREVTGEAEYVNVNLAK
jgi:CHAD domain-containing protein/CYTH domain-containing protein